MEAVIGIGFCLDPLPLAVRDLRSLPVPVPFIRKTMIFLYHGSMLWYYHP